MTRIVVTAILIVSTLWGSIATNLNPFKFDFWGLVVWPYMLAISTPFWCIAYLEIREAWCAARGQRSAYIAKFYKAQNETIINTACCGLIFSFIYWVVPIKYSWNSLDIAGLGLPFYISGIMNVRRLTEAKIANLKPKRAPIYLLLSLYIIFTMVAIYFMAINSAGGFKPYQAIWLQITIFCNGFFFLILSGKSLYFVNNAKMEFPSYIIDAFPVFIVSRFKILPLLAEEVEKWNRHMANEKRSQRKKKR